MVQDHPDRPSWTLEEARSYLPRLRLLLAAVRSAVAVAEAARGNGHRAGVVSDGAEEAEEVPGGPNAEQALEELSERGVILRDLARGLVDFPSRRPSGRTVLLCWERGEEDIGFWHLPEEGFAGRRPLPVPPEI